MSLILKGLHIAGKQLTYLIIILSILLVLLGGSIYLLSNAVAQRQDEIARWISSQVHYPVTIGQAAITWHGIQPKLAIADVQLHNQTKTTVIASLDTLYFGLDLLRSLWTNEPIVSDLTLNGLRIAVLRTQSGQFIIRGLNAESNADMPFDGAWLSILEHIQFNALYVSLLDEQHPAFSGQYQISQAQIAHYANNWQVNIHALLPKQIGKTVNIQATIALNKAQWQQSPWQGRLEANAVHIPNISPYFIGPDIVIERGLGTVNVHLSGQGNALRNLAGQISIQDVLFKSDQKALVSHTLPMRELSGQVQWQAQQDKWQLSVKDLNVNINGEHWPKTSVTVNHVPEKGWTITSPYFRLGAVSSLAVLSAHAPQWLQKLQPAGEVKDCQLRLTDTGDVSELSMTLIDGAWLEWQDIPGVTGLTMEAGWKDRRLNLDVKSHQLRVFAAAWLPHTVFFDSVRGQIRFQQQDQGWALQTDTFRIWNDDLTLELTGNLERNSSGHVISDLALQLENIHVAQWQHYVPQRILTTPFRMWANKAFKSGKIVSGLVSLTGDLADFPYDRPNMKGQFKLALSIEDVQLHYAPHWPDLMHVTGTISGTGNTLVIKSQQGHIAGMDFKSVTTRIDKLTADAPILTTSGVLTGSTQQALSFINQSPLRRRFAQAIKGIKAKGQSQVKLDLQVPLTHPDNTEVSGQVIFENSQLYYTSLPYLKLDRINGQLQFSNQGLKAKNIQAILFDEPVDINVKPLKTATLISLFGTMSVPKIKHQWPEVVPAYIDGRSQYQLEIMVKEKTVGDFYVETELHSDLSGIAIDLPAPLGKTRQQAIPLYVKMHHDASQPDYQLRYADMFTLEAKQAKEGWQAAVHVGQGTATVPDKGIAISGKLSELILDDWLKWAERQQTGQAVSLLNQVHTVAITFDKFTAYQTTFTAFSLAAQKEKKAWHIQVKGDQLQGEIDWLQGGDEMPLNINLDRLNLTFPHNMHSASTHQRRTLWPSMQVHIGALTINNMKLGQLDAKAKRTQNEWIVTHARLQSDSYQANLKQGRWQRLPQGDKTMIHASMQISDLARLSTDWGYLPAMDSHQVKLELSLQWPDEPLGLTAENIQGKLTFDVGQGKFNDVEPGTAGRIFGLMSIAALPRRLALDFSDIFSKDFVFNSITGHFQIAKGLANTEDFLLDSPAAQITMKGPIDLVHRTYDQRVKIRPNVSSTLPLAGAVAGGPVGLGVGAAILLADKLVDSLFGKNIVNVISYTYTLTGPWDKPQFTLLKQNKK